MARTVGTLFGVLLFVLTLNVIECIYLPGLPASFAKYPPWNACTNATFSFEFRTTRANAALMYTDDNGINDFFQVTLTKGKVELSVKIVDDKDGAVRLSKGSSLNDDQWHRVDIKRNRMETTLVVDGAEDRKVAIGSDFYFGRFNEPNNYVYFGGIPLQYHKSLKSLSLPSVIFEPRFAGYIRNVFYGNCTCRTIRGQFIEGVGVSLEPREVCEVRNPCGAGCVCISTDDQPGCNCQDLECSEGKYASLF